MNQETLNTAPCLKRYSDCGIFFSPANTLDAALFQHFKKTKKKHCMVNSARQESWNPLQQQRGAASLHYLQLPLPLTSSVGGKKPFFSWITKKAQAQQPMGSQKWLFFLDISEINHTRRHKNT